MLAQLHTMCIFHYSVVSSISYRPTVLSLLKGVAVQKQCSLGDIMIYKHIVKTKANKKFKPIILLF